MTVQYPCILFSPKAGVMIDAKPSCVKWTVKWMGQDCRGSLSGLSPNLQRSFLWYGHSASTLFF